MTSFLAPYNVVVTREARNSVNPALLDTTTVYSGPGDVQYGVGTLSYGPQGNIVQYDATGIFYPDTTGALPALLVNDKLLVNGTELLIYDVINFPQPLPHLEIKLRRGVVGYSGPH